MKNRITSLASLLISAALLSQSAIAATIETTTRPPGDMSPGCTAGLCINGLGLDSDRYTGWIFVGGYTKTSLFVTFTDANDSVTALQAKCWAALDASGADGTGYEICSGNTATGTTTMTCPHVWQLTTGTSESFVFTVDNLTAKYINCWFHATGTPAAADVITVKALRRTP